MVLFIVQNGELLQIYFDKNKLGYVDSVNVHLNGWWFYGYDFTVYDDNGQYIGDFYGGDNLILSGLGKSIGRLEFYCSSNGYCGIDRLMINTIAVLNLAAQVPQPSQPGATIGSDGLLQIRPSVPVHIDVPVSGVGFNASENRTTTVSVQAGSQTFSKIVSLASIQSAGTLLVPFDVTFGPNDVGVQAITAIIDPGNALQERDFSNNTSSIRVNVAGAQLGITLPDTPLDEIQINGDAITITTPPSVPGDTANHNLVINCVDPKTNQRVDKCKYTISMSVTHDGGHHTESHTGDRPQIELDPDDALSSPQEIANPSGESITLTLPEVSGETTFTINGTGPGGEQLPSKKVVFDVKIKNLFDLRALGINFHDITHHPDDGFYGNYYFMAALQALLVKYNSAVMAMTGHAPKILQSQSGSLSWGGLFDYPGLWKTPHSRHRDGSDIDLDLPANRQERRNLAQIVYNSKNLSFNPAESPNPPPGSAPVTHWHVWIHQ